MAIPTNQGESQIVSALRNIDNSLRGIQQILAQISSTLVRLEMKRR